MEGVDFNETFAPVAQLESIHLPMAFACTLKFKSYQMDVKSAFWNGYLHEEVFVAQPNHVFGLKKCSLWAITSPKSLV